VQFKSQLLDKEIQIDTFRKLVAQYRLKDKSNYEVKISDSLKGLKVRTNNALQNLKPDKTWSESWFKEGYFIQFDDIKVLLKKINAKRSITVEVCNMIGAAVCKKPIATPTVFVGSTYTFTEGPYKYSITLNKIAGAGKNVFTNAGYIVFKRVKNS
jgi:hypothetical protein